MKVVVLKYMKRQVFAALVMIGSAHAAMSQGNPASVALPQGPPPVPMFIEDINGRPFSAKNAEDIEGTPFLLPDWNWGAVKFKNGRFAKDLSLRFNVYNNQLYFQKGESQLEFVTPVHEFMIGYKKDADSMAVVYRNGYPATEKTTPETFLELLADGQYQLLKHHNKQIRTYKPYNASERKQFADSEQLYLFADGNMIKLRKDKDAILKAIPQHAATIEAIASEKKLKVKSEEDMARLIAALNEKLVASK
jgi:hypothetical protein